MHNEGASRVFGWVSITTALCSFYFGFQGNENTALFVSLMTWGVFFLAVGIVLLLIKQIF